MAIAAIAGGLARSMGGKMMHSSSAATRSFGSKMLKTSDKKIQGGIDKIAKHTQMSLGLIKKSNVFLGKMASILAKSSPAFAQQMIILNKGIKLWLRPIGDMLSLWLRPMAIWVLRKGGQFYNWLSKLTGRGGEKGSESYLLDEIKQLNIERESAIKQRDFEKAEKLGEKIEEKRAAIPVGPIVPTDKEFYEKSAEQINEAIKTGGDKMIEKWQETGEEGETAAGLVTIGLGQMGTKGKLVTGDTEKGFKDAGVESDKMFEKVTAGWTGEAVRGKSFWESTAAGWLDAEDESDTFWSGVSSWIDKLKKKIGEDDDKPKKKTLIEKVWDSVAGAWKTLTGGVDFGSGSFGSGAGGSFATGGAIGETGIYKLHAGERVLTSGDTSRAISNDSQINVENTFNINANINSDIDIQNLADRLADLQETELRRRVSYI